MRLSLSLSLALSVAACATSPTTPELTSQQAAKVGSAAIVATLDPALQAVRAATARYHSFEQAGKRGYTYLFNGACFADPARGAMGYHYVNTALLDGTADALAPEAVMYEPQANGTLKLVGLEYVIPAPAWTSTTPPSLFGRDYSYNATFDLWTLHVWLWQENPNGLFEPWNPTVSCANAAPAAVSKEHAH